MPNEINVIQVNDDKFDSWSYSRDDQGLPFRAQSRLQSDLRKPLAELHEALETSSQTPTLIVLNATNSHAHHNSLDPDIQDLHRRLGYASDLPRDLGFVVIADPTLTLSDNQYELTGWYRRSMEHEPLFYNTRSTVVARSKTYRNKLEKILNHFDHLIRYRNSATSRETLNRIRNKLFDTIIYGSPIASHTKVVQGKIDVYRERLIALHDDISRFCNEPEAIEKLADSILGDYRRGIQNCKEKDSTLCILITCISHLEIHEVDFDSITTKGVKLLQGQQSNGLTLVETVEDISRMLQEYFNAGMSRVKTIAKRSGEWAKIKKRLKHDIAANVPTEKQRQHLASCMTQTSVI